MKLTKETICYNESDTCYDIFIKDLAEPVQQQILENQKIVDTLLTSYNHDYDNPGFPVGESASAYARWIIKEATGKEIQEIQFQPKVKDEK